MPKTPVPVSSRPAGAGRGDRKSASVPAWIKAAIVGCGLIALIVAVVGVAYLNVQTTAGSAHQLADAYQPALEHLLRTEQALHEAQAAVGDYFASPGTAGRDSYRTRFREQLQLAEREFLAFETRVPSLPDPSDRRGDFRSRLNGWQQLVTTAFERESGRINEFEFGEMMIQYAGLREALHNVIDQGLGPAMRAAGTRLIEQSDSARRMLAATLGVALLLGGGVTWAGVRAIRNQHNEILVEKAERESEAQRRDFEHRLHRAFELVQSESSAYRIVGDALSETLRDGHEGELLIADSSVAHLERAVATSATPGRTGCSVTDPQDCPAIRRNSPMAFPTSDVFEACPYLRRRFDEPCSAVCVPISIMGRTTGVLHVVATVDDPPNDTDRRALGAIAAAVGDELGLIRAFATKSRLADTDTLTGLANRRSLEACMMEVAARGDYAVAYIDIDRFKPLNDTHGHDTGDRALRLFADVLRHAVRPDDIAARWGGEEFVIVLPGLDSAGAVPVLGRIRERLRDALAHVQLPSFTISSGISDSLNASTFDNAVALADEALLRAKRGGRDRVVLAGAGQRPDPTAAGKHSLPPARTGTD